MSFKEYVWQEIYRAKELKDLIIPNEVRNIFEKFIQDKEITHLLFFGTPGTQKTTSSNVLINELHADSIYINASNETGIDVVRNKIIQYISSPSLKGQKKIVILDECENASSLFQSSLKSILEKYSKFAKFILITNHIDKIDKALISRCMTINFNFQSQEEIKELKSQYLKRCLYILKNEGFELKTKSEMEVIVKIVKDYFPDFRIIVRTLQEMALRSENGVLNISYTSFNDRLDKIIELIFEKNVIKLREYILKNFVNKELSLIYNYFDMTS